MKRVKSPTLEQSGMKKLVVIQPSAGTQLHSIQKSLLALSNRIPSFDSVVGKIQSLSIGPITFRLSFLIIFALLLSSIAINMYARPEPFLPTHGDEWDVLIYVQEMQEQETVVFYDPSVPEQPTITAGPHYRLEMNYNLFIFSLLNLTRINPLHLPFLVTTLLSFLLSLGAFLMIRRFSKSNLAGLIAGIAVFGLKNNVALLGYSFMAPMGFGLAMIPLLIYTFMHGLHKTRFFLLFAILLFNLFFTHPVYAVLMVPVGAVFFLFRPGLLIKNFVRLFLVSILIFGTGVLALRNLFQGNFSDALVKLVVFPYGEYITQFPLVGYIHPLEFVVIGVGLGILLLFSFPRPYALNNFMGWFGGKLRTPFRPEFNFALFTFIFAIIWIYLRWFSDINTVCFFGPCRRTSVGFVILLLILGGLGIFFLTKLILQTVFRAYGKWVQRVLDVFATLILAVMLFQYILVSSVAYETYSVTTQANFPDFEWMNELPEDSVIRASFPSEKPVVLIADKTVPAANRARLGNISPFVSFRENFVSRVDNYDPPQEIGFFFQRSCKDQKLILEKYAITHEYDQQVRGCSKTNRVYDGGDWHVREIIK